jgi:predicted small secreted protein
MRESGIGLADMKPHRLLLIAIVAAFGLSFGLSGCDTDDGPAEEMGKAIDDAGENTQDAAKKAGNAVEDACEDAKEGVDANDTDC